MLIFTNIKIFRKRYNIKVLPIKYSIKYSANMSFNKNSLLYNYDLMADFLKEISINSFKLFIHIILLICSVYCANIRRN